ncbi:MAG: electron transfer flavoprotein subunit alpha/FixB family protein [Propionibacteriaceae bacterium]|nr:electron transfer flavoprotein subunit alpha/FixB family protein [Propionibacteriaceae bacterium]
MSTYILVAGSSAVAELVTTAAGLGRGVVAVVVGSEDLAKAVGVDGVDSVVWLGDPGDKAIEAFAPAVASLVAADPGVVVSGRKPQERVLLGAAAAALGCPVVSGSTEVVAEGASTVVTVGVYGGIALATWSFDSAVALVMDGGAAVTGGGSAPIQTVTADTNAITVVSVVPNAVAAADLGGAARVVGVGRGLKSPDDLGVIEALAAAMKAEVGCSRPVAEGLEWLPKDRYVGISGQHIAPALYLMVGISGQIQHMGGCRGAGVIVSVNSDKDAPVVKESDFVLTGDLYALVPAITAALS